ncbi:hypothetical protein U1Q18_005196, partial [Sarracenia purpurea var. burkii]
RKPRDPRKSKSVSTSTETKPLLGKYSYGEAESVLPLSPVVDLGGKIKKIRKTNFIAVISVSEWWLFSVAVVAWKRK